MHKSTWPLGRLGLTGKTFFVIAGLLFSGSCIRAPPPVVSPGRCGFGGSSVLASWGKPVVYEVNESGQQSVAKRWHASLWLPERPTEKARRYRMSCASSFPLSMVLAARRPATFVLLSGRGGESRRLGLGQATLAAPGAGGAALRETSTREVMRNIPAFDDRHGPQYLFAFERLKPAWSQLELRVPFHGGAGHLRVHFMRKACAVKSAK
jgi:hypothetical protein